MVCTILLAAIVSMIGPVSPSLAGATGGDRELVSRTTRGDPANGDSRAIAITPNARFVVFVSNADNLPGPDVEDPAFLLMYRRDLRSGTTRLVSRARDGAPLAVSDLDGDISADGRIVTFVSSGITHPPGVYVRDVAGNLTRIASRRGTSRMPWAVWPQLSADGSKVAFVGSTGPLGEQLYVRDLARRRTRLLLRDADGRPGATSWVGPPGISADGRWIAFEAEADASPPSCAGEPHIYEWKTRSLDCPVEGWGPDGPESVAISRTGRYLAWHEFDLKTTDLSSGATIELGATEQGYVAPSWSADERFLIWLGYFGAQQDIVTYRFDLLGQRNRLVARLDEGSCDPALRAPDRHAAHVLVTCGFPDAAGAGAYLVSMPS
jgi:Tol biopolymer transport system component